MTFLNLAILGGLALVAIPVIIHLLNRRKARVVDWGAMRFLLASLVSRNRRILIEEIILMVLRCLLVALLVLAMARPFLPAQSSLHFGLVLLAVLLAAMLIGVAAAAWSHKLPRWVLLGSAAALLALAGAATAYEHFVQARKWSLAGGEKDVAIIIDSSASMMLTVDGKTNFQRAVDEARAAVAACRPADAVSVIAGAQAPRRVVPSPISDRQELSAALGQCAPIGGAMNAVDSLRAAGASLAEGANPVKKIVIISDQQATGWELANSARWAALASELKGLGPTRPQILWRALPLPTAVRNVAITEMTLGRQVIGTDREVAINVKLTNSGNGAITPGVVELLVDGAKAANLQASELAAGESEVLTFTHRFAAPGAHVVTAQVASDDDMPADNAVSRAVAVLGALPVLIVNGSPSPDIGQDAAAMAEIALSLGGEPPPAAGKSKPESSYQSQVLCATTVTPAVDVAKSDFAQYRVVILADVPRLPTATAAALADYVRGGGGLLIAAGGSSDRQFYNGWQAAPGEPVCPARLGEKRQVLAEPAHLSVSSFTHPSLKWWAGEFKGAERVLIKAHWPLDVPAQDPSVRVGGLLDSGHAMLVERRLGKGCVLMLPFGLDRQDSSNWEWVFPVALHEMAYYLAAGSVANLNVAPAGQVSLDVPLAAGKAAAEAGSGLKAEYFSDKDLANRKFIRTDATINFDWSSQSPDSRLARENFSVRWSGQVRPAYSEDYTFIATSDDGVRVWVDGKQIIDGWDVQAAKERSVKVPLKADRKYDIRVEYFQGDGSAVMKLEWASRSQKRSVLPPDRLYPAAGAAAAVDTAGASSQTVTLRTPSGKMHQAPATIAGNSLRLTVANADEPGLWRVLRADAPQGEEGLPFVVTSDPAECRLDRISSADMARLGHDIDLFGAASTDQMVAALTGNVPGEELWKYLAVAALIGLVVEIGLTRWIASQRKTGAVQAVHFGDEADAAESFRARAKQMVAVGQQSPAEVAKP
jgi:hypothetical protein